MSLRGYVCHASPCARCVCRHTFFLHALKEKQLHPPSRAEQKQTEASLHQGFAKVAPIGSKPPPQINKERVAAVARPRHSGHTLFSSFLGRGGEEEKDFSSSLKPASFLLDRECTLRCMIGVDTIEHSSLKRPRGTVGKARRWNSYRSWRKS